MSLIAEGEAGEPSPELRLRPSQREGDAAGASIASVGISEECRYCLANPNATLPRRGGPPCYLSSINRQLLAVFPKRNVFRVMLNHFVAEDCFEEFFLLSHEVA